MPSQPTVRLEPIGQCIYCGSRGSLTDEHIVPAGLDGNYVLPKASCHDCARTTSGFESKVLNSIRDLRAGIDMGGRRRKSRPRTAPLTLVSRGIEILHRLAFREHLLPLMLPVFPEPGCFTRDQPKQGIDLIGLRIIKFGQEPNTIAAQQGAEGIKIEARMHPVEFARMLAKIGYCYAVAHWGLDAFSEVFVLPAIRGQTDDVGHWVGTYIRDHPKSDDPTLIHQLEVIADSGGLHNGVPITHALAHIQLFANSPSPVYRVVVGKLRSDYRREGESSP